LLDDDNLSSIRAGVPNLGYMYPWGYICLSQTVYLLYTRNKLTLRQKMESALIFVQI